jgi:hypothetical protein
MNDISEFLSKIDLVPQREKLSNMEANVFSNSISIEINNCYFPSTLIAKYYLEKNIPIKTSKIECFNYEKFCQTNIQLKMESLQKTKRKSNEKQSDLTKTSMIILGIVVQFYSMY